MEIMLICHHVLFVVLLMLLISHGSSAAGDASNCSDTGNPVIVPSRLVVRFNDPASAICMPSKSCSNCRVKWESNIGSETTSNNLTAWKVDNMTSWSLSCDRCKPLCYIDTDDQCQSELDIIVYKPPDSVSISYVNHIGPEFEAQQYTLQCQVQDVAPVENLTVTFYRGQKALGPPQSSNRDKKTPVNETFSLNVTSSIEDDGAVYWCEAKLDLGPDGPQTPPVVKSNNLTATVHYKPQRESGSENIPITAGDHLHLNCSAIGNPSTAYTWTLPPAVSNKDRTSCCLTFDSITFDDGGEYTCVASNIVGNITMLFHVNVEVDLLPIIAGLVAVGLVLLLAVFGFVYSSHYRRNHMGQYTLKDMLPFRRRNHDHDVL